MIKKTISDKSWKIVALNIFFLDRETFIMVVDAYGKFIEVQKLNVLSTESTIKL